MVKPLFLWQMFQTTEADVIASFVHARLMLLPVVVLWQMLCHLICYDIFELADVIAKWLMELPLYDSTWLMLLPGD